MVYKNNIVITMIKYTSYVNERFNIFKKSINSLIESIENIENINYKIIIADNGEEGEEYCINLLKEGKIHSYVRLNNIGLTARNIGLDLAKTVMPDVTHISICDDDLYFKNGWLEECLDVLNKYPDEKIIATPFRFKNFLKGKFNRGVLPDGHMLNARAGSCCRVYRIDDFAEIGRVNASLSKDNFRKAGIDYIKLINESNYNIVLTNKLLIKHLVKYPAQIDASRLCVINYIKEHIKNINKGITISRAQGTYGNKNKILGNIEAYLLYNFKELFLNWVYPLKENLTEIQIKENLNKIQKNSRVFRLYPDRFNIIKDINEVKDEYIDFIFLDSSIPFSLYFNILQQSMLKIKSGGIILGILIKNKISLKNISKVTNCNISTVPKSNIWFFIK